MTDILEVYFAILPDHVDDDDAPSYAIDKAREKGLIPTDADVELRTAKAGGRAVRIAEVICRKPNGWGRNPEIMFAPLFRGLVQTRRGIKRRTGQLGVAGWRDRK